MKLLTTMIFVGVAFVYGLSAVKAATASVEVVSSYNQKVEQAIGGAY